MSNSCVIHVVCVKIFQKRRGRGGEGVASITSANKLLARHSKLHLHAIFEGGPGAECAVDGCPRCKGGDATGDEG